MDQDVLVVVTDFEKGFVGSRHISRETYRDEAWCRGYLDREFPSIKMDNILFINNDIIIAEWMFGRKAHE